MVGYQSLMHKNIEIKYHNERLGATLNKFRAVNYCSAEYVALIDSDNYLCPDYLRTAVNQNKNTKTIYSPGLIWINKPGHERWVYPSNYLFSEGDLLTRLDSIFVTEFGTMLNTGNYLVPRENYLLLSETMANYDFGSYECMAVNILWLMSGGFIECLPQMTYVHDTTSQDGVYRGGDSRLAEYQAKILTFVQDIITQKIKTPTLC
jgi:glycosyltransferase involved in cell wall biosynthesis